jgi:hypothetical protein
MMLKSKNHSLLELFAPVGVRITEIKEEKIEIKTN